MLVYAGSNPASDLFVRVAELDLALTPKLNSGFPNNILQFYSEYCKSGTLKVLYIYLIKKKIKKKNLVISKIQLSSGHRVQSQCR